MPIWFHSTILATVAAATIAVSIASAAKYEALSDSVAPKSDMLPMATPASDTREYVTVEARTVGKSVLARVPVDVLARIQSETAVE